MNTLLERKVILSDLKRLFNKSEKHILSFMNTKELELLNEYIPLFDQVTRIDLELKNIDSLPNFDEKSNMYVPTLKSIVDNFNDWKLISYFDIFEDNDNTVVIDFSKIKKNLCKLSNPILNKKLGLKISMWEKENVLSHAIDNATKKMFLNISLRKMIDKNRLKSKR